MENEEIKKVINGLNFLKEKLYNGICADRLDCNDYAISALKEVQQYREIGTVEECRKAVEKQKAKETIRIAGRYPYKCPTCNGKLEIGYRHCIICGQLLRYPYENLEGMEDERDLLQRHRSAGNKMRI